MNDYVRSVQLYLGQIGEIEPKKLGDMPAGAPVEVLAGAQSSLERSLRNDARATDRIIVLAVVLLCCLFVSGIVFMVYYRRSPEMVAVIFGGGSFASMLGIVVWLRKLWFDKRTMDLLLVLTQSMTPADAAKTVTSFYFAALSPRQATR